MKTRANIFRILVLGSLLALGSTGCHKQTISGDAPATLPDGVARLQAALASASPQTQSNIAGLYSGIRYSDYPKATSALQQIASDPSLNDKQKKLVDQVRDLLKQAAGSQPEATQPAQ